MKINIKLLAIVMVLSSVFVLPYLHAEDDDDFISVSPVKQKDTGSMMEEGIVTKIEKPKPKATVKPKPVAKVASTLAGIDKIITSLSGDKVKVRVTTSKKVKFKATELTSPSRILLQLEKCGATTKTIKANKGPVNKIRTAPHNSTAWVVIDLSSKAKWKTNTDGRNIIVEIDSKGKSKTVAKKAIVKTRTPGSMIYRVIDVAAKDLDKKTRVIVTTDGPVKYRLKKDGANKILTVNIVDAISSWKKTSTNINKGMVESVSVSENSKSKIVDVNIKLTSDAPYTVTRDQNQIVIDVDNRDYRATKKKRKLDLNQKISLNIQNASLPGVLRLLATQTGFEFVAHPSVSEAEPVTIREDNQPLENVLRDILVPQEFFYEVRKNIIKVGKVTELKKDKALLPKVSTYYYPRSMKADDLESFLSGQIANDKLLDVVRRVDTAAGANRMLIHGTQGDIDKVMDMIASIDVGGSGDYDENGYSGLKTKVFKLQHIRLAPKNQIPAETDVFEADSLVELKEILVGLKSSEGQINYDYRTSSIIVTDTADKIRKIGKVIATLDVKLSQVSIEAKLYEVNVNEAKELGINWTAESQGQQPFIRGESVPAAVAGIGKLAIETMQNGFNISAYLNALERQTSAKLLSSPKITVASNRTAKIETSSNTSYKESTVTYSSTGQPSVSEAFKIVNLPITLSVVPKITDSNEIEMNIFLRVVKLLDASAEGPPETSEQTASTNIKAKNNETIVIGGLITERKTIKEDKVPILGDIPLIGLLFQGKKENLEKVELVVFITPSILED